MKFPNRNAHNLTLHHKILHSRIRNHTIYLFVSKLRPTFLPPPHTLHPPHSLPMTPMAAVAFLIFLPYNLHLKLIKFIRVINFLQIGIEKAIVFVGVVQGIGDELGIWIAVVLLVYF